jgi:hypothetical protein
MGDSKKEILKNIYEVLDILSKKMTIDDYLKLFEYLKDFKNKIDNR